MSDGITVLVTGGRYYDDKRYVDLVLDGFHTRRSIKLLVTGACPYGGADKLAEDWARENEIDYAGYPAKFKAHGKPAGPIRNARMIELKPDLVIAFPGGNGTANTVSLARQAGIEVFVA